MLLVFWGEVGSAMRHACLFEKGEEGCLCVGCELEGLLGWAAWEGRLSGLNLTWPPPAAPVRGGV